MLLHIPDVLDAMQLAEFNDALATAEWVDGGITAGGHARRVKNNSQVPEDHPIARRLGEVIVGSLDRNRLFRGAALPLKIVPPLFNRYEGGEAYGNHVDSAIRPVIGSRQRIRTDLSATLFLSPTAAYDGGELVIDAEAGTQRVKLAAGSMILYPSSSLHRVEPVTRGSRLAAFFWIESMVRDHGQRRLLFDLDIAIQQLAGALPENPAVDRLVHVYHNLLRQWAVT